MSKLAPLLLRLFFIFAFVYAWYLIASSPSEKSSVLLSDENSDLQKQAILRKLEDDKSIPTSKNSPTDGTNIDKSKEETGRVPLKSQKNVSKNVQIEISREHQSDLRSQLYTEENNKQDTLDLANKEVPLQQIVKTESITPPNSNSDLKEQSIEIVNKFDSNIPDLMSTANRNFTRDNKTDFIFDKTINKQNTPSSRSREDTAENVLSENNPENMDAQAIPNKDGDGNIFKNIWNKIIDPLTNVADHYEGGKGPCPTGDVLTIIGGGRLANCIWQYVTVRSLSRFLPGQRTPYVQKFIIDSLSDIYDNLTLPIVEDIPKDCKCCENINWYKKNIHIYSFIPLRYVRRRFKDVPGNLILPKYSLLIEPVMAERQNIIKELTFKSEIHEAATDTIKRNTENFYQNNNIGDAKITYVGVHVRRTDYIYYLNNHYNLTEATSEYYISAMDYFRLRRPDLGKPVFLITTDDVPWVEQNLLGKSDVYSVSSGTPDKPGHDLAVLCYCNHSIIDYGTFGLWAAVYAGGETISIKTSNQVYQILGKEKNWHFVHLDGTKPEIF